MSSLSISQTSQLASGIVGWWKMDEGSGNTTADASVNGNTATLNASYTFTVSWITTSPTAGAVYSNNSNNFTVIKTTLSWVAPNISGSLICTGTWDPTSWVLAKVSGTGDSNVNFSAFTNTWSSSTPTLKYPNPYCLSFNGLQSVGTQYLSIPDSDSLSFTNGSNDLPFSFSGWVYPTSYGSATWQWLISKRDTTIVSQTEWQIYIVNGQIRLYIFSGGGATVYISAISTTAVALNTWTQVGCSYKWNGLNTWITLYIAWVPVTMTLVSAGTYAWMTNTTSKTYIGTSWWSINSYPFTGRLDDFRVYNRVLSDDEMYLLSLGVPNYWATNSGSRSLIWYRPFEEWTGTTTTDRSWNWFTSTLSGTTPPTWVNGLFGKALSFDGSSSCIALPNAIYDAQRSGSISAWVYIKVKPTNTLFMNILSAASVTSGTGLLRLGLYWYGTSARLTINERKANNMIYGSTLLALNTRYFVVITADRTSRKMYVNWKLETVNILVWTNIWTWFNDSVIGVMNYSIWSRQGLLPWEYWNGYLEDVRIYDRTLSTSEISYLYFGK